MIFLDVSKAFDRVWNKSLIYEIKKKENTTIEWWDLKLIKKFKTVHRVSRQNVLKT